MNSQLIAEQRFSGSSLSPLILAQPAISGFLKVLIAGEISVQGDDRYFVLRLNGKSEGYESIFTMSANQDDPDREGSGFGLGRTARSLDAAFSMELTLGLFEHSDKITMTGKSAFALANNTVHEVSLAGVHASGPKVERLDLHITGGFVNGIGRIYHL